ncbi:uncharacterized protein K460DRAFT_368313 [Cucurbitaria berberidis CBS 394.84]|uniref:Uncharacterized protein n=1 Tax=Cucurbitaria berberidis CBS 394.84 TaxID=1168544 RepID=A0A9P4GDW1_9PLEO|nr:uncharacterized protein K460DRAFT_368313 [Cucurbitaria berberidis CBS 394.84]KAF1843415.1 hypothetical protein K460DRAFT_368313 [Cucurbitaria berberidis CBS 394.84]
MVKGEILTFGAAAGAIGGAYKLGEFMLRAKRLRDVGPSNAVYVRIIGRVRSDLDEVKRLLSVREVHDALESNPEKSKWVYGAMRDVRGALENITPHTERVGGDVEDGRRVGVRHRVYWLVSEKEKLENREKELNIAHASLTEVLGYLTALEPVEEKHKPKKSSSKKDTHVDIDIDIKRDAPQHTTERVERDVWVERDAAPRRVEEHRDVWIEHDRQGPPPAHYEEHRDVYVNERERGPQHYEEHDVHAQHGRDPRYEAQHSRDPRYEAQYDERYEQHDHYERRPQYPEERRHDERPFPEPLGRRPESFEDRLPERDTWMQSEARNRSRGGQGGPYGQYAEYGAPQPVGAAHYHRRFQGDAGFGDEEILNPQPVPLDRKYAEREVSGHRYSKL